MAKNKVTTNDRHKNWLDVTHYCIDEVTNVMEKCEDIKTLPLFIVQILTEMLPFTYDELRDSFAGVKSKPYYKKVDTKEELIENVTHFISYNLLDDGEISLIDNKIAYPDYSLKEHWADNITDTGMSLWMLEQLGINIPCVCINPSQPEVELFESNCFSQYVIDFKKYLEVNGLDTYYSRIDMYSKSGDKTLWVIAKK
jgi:hypothetical protein